MSDAIDHAEYARRALEWLGERAAERANLDGLVLLADIEPNIPPGVDPDVVLWAHCGRILRERDPETYEQLQTMAISLAVLASEQLPPSEN